MQDLKKISTEEDFIDIGKIFRLLLMQSKLIIFIVAVLTSIGIYNYASADKYYRVTSLLQVLPKENNMSAGFTGDLTLGGAYAYDINNTQQLYKSRYNLLAVINELCLNVDIKDMENQDKNFIKKFLINDYDNSSSVNLILMLNQDGFVILTKDSEELAKGNYNEMHSNDFMHVEFSEPQQKLINKKYEVNVMKPEDYYRTISGMFQIDTSIRSPYQTLFNSGTILQINFTTNDIDEGIRILNFSNNNFINQNIEIETEQARKALDYIELQSFEIEQQLNEKKSVLKNFREINKTIDVDLEIQSIISSLETIDSNLNKIDVEIEMARNNYTENNPIFLNLLNQKRTLTQQRTTIEQEIENLPLSQQQYIDIFRDVELTQDIYNELQNRRLEYSIKEASTIGNLRVVDSAYMANQVSPQLSSVVFMFILSTILSFIIAVFRGLFFIPISNPAELQDSNIDVPIVGVINMLDDTEDTNDDERFNQSIESLIVNIGSKSSDPSESSMDAKIITITSPTAQNGKSFVSRSVAKKISKLGNKVLLLDSDYKRGNQHKSFNLEKITTKEFFDINENSLEKFKTSDENLYLIPKITRITSSFEFLYDPRFQEKIELFKREFDYIIIDTAPILSVSDTLILMSYSDVPVCLVRHGFTKVNEIKQTMAVFNQIGMVPKGIIYNCYEKPSSYYGYYGMYGNYSYQYYANRYLYQNYDYEKES